MFFRQKVIRTRLLQDAVCHPPAVLPFEFQNFKKREMVEQLAEIWNANFAAMIRDGRHIQIVRFEDLVDNPQFASESIMRHLRMTLPVPQLNRILR